MVTRFNWLGRTAFATFCFGTLVLLFAWRHPGVKAVPVSPILREPSRNNPPVDHPTVVCSGPRGIPLNEQDSQDLPRPLSVLSNVSYPQPTIGSYEALGLEKIWTSFEQRYGPFGYGEEEDTYGFPRVDWNTVDWGHLQTECLEKNEHALSTLTSGNKSAVFHAGNRFRILDDGPVPVPPASKTGRQAIVMRSWSTYEYKDEDLWNIRSIITEASLATGGKYSVFLLVDVKCEGCETIHTDEKEYRRVLEQSVPIEFRNIAVLFHHSMLESWYAKVSEHKPFWQIMQPLQLFSHFYPEFDHFWQFEMDTRFTGNVGKMLDAFDSFGKTQPYKQALERASWDYIPRIHGTYQEFSVAIDKAMNGGASVWGPIKVKHVEPIGPEPPFKEPKDENFQWRVGHDADLLLLGQLSDVRRFERFDDWIFKDWQKNLKDFASLPRYMSVPAQARASWELLQGIHRAQHDHGLAVASEATLPTFAVWLGLKIVGLPVPKFQFPERDILELNFAKNGNDYGQGIASGPAVSRGSSLAFFIRPLTWDWWSSLCDPAFIRWMGRQPEHYKGDGEPHTDPVYVQVPDELPTFMAESEGTVFMPGLIMHPRKSNNYRSAE